MVELDLGEKLLLAASLLVSAALAALWLLAYPMVASYLAPGLAPRFRVEHFLFIPVIADEGTVVLVTGALVLALLPLHLYLRRLASTAEKLEEQVAEFLAVYTGVAASTTNVYDALMHTAEMLAEPLSRVLERAARLYRATGNLEQAFEEAMRGVPRRARLFARSAVVAARTGGDPARVVSNVAAYAREMRRLAVTVRSRLSEYKLVVALASLTYAVAAGVVLGLVRVMQGLSLPGGRGLSVDPGVLLGLYYYSLLIISLASAAVMSRIIQGSLLYMPKYFSLLLAASLLVFLASPLLVHAG